MDEGTLRDLKLLHEPFLPMLLLLLAGLILLDRQVFGEAFNGGWRLLDELDGPRVGKRLVVTGSCLTKEAVGLPSRDSHWV